jgi:hypothetical protein
VEKTERNLSLSSYFYFSCPLMKTFIVRLIQAGQNVYFQQHNFLGRSLSGCLPGILSMISGYKFLEL